MGSDPITVLLQMWIQCQRIFFLELIPVFAAGFLQNVADMVFDGVFRDEQGFGDLAVGPARNDHAEDITFAGGQVVVQAEGLENLLLGFLMLNGRLIQEPVQIVEKKQSRKKQ